MLTVRTRWWLLALALPLVLAACTSTPGRPTPGTGTTSTVAGHQGLSAVRHVWVIELGAAADAAQVAAEVMLALGVRQDPGRAPLKVLAEVLAPRRLLLILDNCEHVLSAVAELCGVLLGSADEVHVLATSREQLGLGGEVRYRLSPLALPDSDEPGAVRESAAAGPAASSRPGAARWDPLPVRPRPRPPPA